MAGEIDLEQKLLENEWRMLQLQIRLVAVTDILVSLIAKLLAADVLPNKERHVLEELGTALRRSTEEARWLGN